MVLAVAVGLVLTVYPAFSEMRHHEKGEYKEKVMEKREKILDELGLTDEQKEEMTRLRKANGKKKKETRAALKEKKKELRKELERYDSDTRKVSGLAADIKELQGALIDTRVSSIIDTKSILTKEQFEKFTEKTKHHGKKRSREMGRKQHRW